MSVGCFRVSWLLTGLSVGLIYRGEWFTLRNPHGPSDATKIKPSDSMDFLFTNTERLMAEGILPYRGSIMLDTVFIAMMAVLPVQAVSVYLVKYKKRFVLHRNIQVITAIVLLITIVAFEVDLRFVTDWRSMAESSSLYESGWVDLLLIVHLFFAIPTPFIWGWTIFAAIKNFGWDIKPNEYGRRHVRWGCLAVIMMAMTSVTGWAFYIAAFVM